MNGMDNILRRIREDAQRETDAMRQEAREKTDAIRAKGRETAERLLAEGRQKNAELAENRRTRLVSAANMEARQMVLQTKQACIDQVFEQAYQKVTALPDGEYIDYLAAWVAGAAESGSEELILSPQDRERVGQALVSKANALREGGAFTLAEETRELRGVILRRGSVEINGSLDYRFRLLRERMAAQVAQMLFR